MTVDEPQRGRAPKPKKKKQRRWLKRVNLHNRPTFFRDILEVSHLQEDSSPIQLGTKGRHQGVGFEVVGRIQLKHERGYWNEWYVWTSDGDGAWLGEAQGHYVFTRLVEGWEGAPDFQNLTAGRKLQLDGVSRDVFWVVDKQQSRCIGGEGELPFKVRDGYEAPVVDLASHGRAFATLDYSENPPLLFFGQQATFDELELENLRDLEGW